MHRFLGLRGRDRFRIDSTERIHLGVVERESLWGGVEGAHGLACVTTSRIFLFSVTQSPPPKINRQQTPKKKGHHQSIMVG